jgi:hypothetical protein
VQILSSTIEKITNDIGKKITKDIAKKPVSNDTESEDEENRATDMGGPGPAPKHGKVGPQAGPVQTKKRPAVPVQGEKRRAEEAVQHDKNAAIKKRVVFSDKPPQIRTYSPPSSSSEEGEGQAPVPAPVPAPVQAPAPVPAPVHAPAPAPAPAPAGAYVMIDLSCDPDC